jgi:hypothetical protein
MVGMALSSLGRQGVVPVPEIIQQSGIGHRMKPHQLHIAPQSREIGQSIAPMNCASG